MARGTQCLNLFLEFGCTCGGGVHRTHRGKSSPQRKIRASHCPPSCLWTRCVLKTILWKHCQSSPGWWPLEPSAQTFPETSMSLSNWPGYQGTVGVPKAPRIAGVGGKGLKKTKVSVRTEQRSLKASSGVSAWQLKIKRWRHGEACL